MGSRVRARSLPLQLIADKRGTLRLSPPRLDEQVGRFYNFLAPRRSTTLQALFRFSHECEKHSALAESLENQTRYVAVFIAGEMKDQRRSIQIEFVG